MSRTVSCRDAGLECDWHACADTDEELLEQARIHARDEHGVPDLAEEIVRRAQGAIKEGPCPTAIH